MAHRAQPRPAAGMGFDAPAERRPERPGGRRAGRRRRRARGGAGRARRGADGELGRRRRTGCGGRDPEPRTVASAVRAAPPRRRRWRWCPCPAPHAFAEAMDALQAGLSVMVFSDNVPVEQEVALKDEAARRGLLVMGPDCGTAVVGGVGLGFANVVRPGPVGIVAAVRHRRPAADVPARRRRGSGSATASASAGATCRRRSAAARRRPALRAARRRPGDRADRAGVQAAGPGGRRRRRRPTRRRCRTPVLLGAARRRPPGPHRRRAERPSSAVGVGWTWPSRGPGDRQPAPAPAAAALRGLFAGGTLCDEAMLIAGEPLGPVRPTSRCVPSWAVGAGPARRRAR